MSSEPPFRLRENPQKLQRVSQVMRTISHPVRLMIVEFLLKKGRHSVKTIYQEMGISQSNASQHLKLMEQAGVLSYEREGTSIFYLVSNPGMEKLLKSACDCFNH
jgi:DNA-binding transcriptional ArsR family regulator